jgi:uridine kinase
LRPFLIGIAGLSGSGKTAVARKLAPHLHAETITLDAYYHSQSHLSLEERARLNYDHPDSLDWPLLIAHLSALARGESIDEPQYLFDRHTRAQGTRRVCPQPILIVEGILALHHPDVRSLLDLSVFVATRDEECLLRRLERDIAERGRTRESVLDQYYSTVWPMALQYVLPSRDHAGLVVSGEEPLDDSVAAVLRIVQVRYRAATAGSDLFGSTSPPSPTPFLTEHS